MGDAYANDRARVFHSWSAQGALDPIVIAGALGSKFWDDDRPGVDRLRLDARQHEPRTPAPEDDPGDQGPGRHAVHGGPAVRQRSAQRGRPPDRREGQPRARRRGPRRRPLREGVLHQRRCRRRRERGAPGQGLHRPDEGAVGISELPRRHSTVGRPHRRTATPGERAIGAGPGEVLGAVPVPVGVPLRLARAGDRASTRPSPRHDRDGRCRTRSRRSSSKRSSARTASWCRRRATSKGCGRSATSSGSCGSPTRSWPGSAAPDSGSPGRTGMPSRISSRSRRASTPATSHSEAS